MEGVRIEKGGSVVGKKGHAYRGGDKQPEQEPTSPVSYYARQQMDWTETTRILPPSEGCDRVGSELESTSTGVYCRRRVIGPVDASVSKIKITCSWTKAVFPGGSPETNHMCGRGLSARASIFLRLRRCFQRPDDKVHPATPLSASSSASYFPPPESSCVLHHPTPPPSHPSISPSNSSSSSLLLSSLLRLPPFPPPLHTPLLLIHPYHTPPSDILPCICFSLQITLLPICILPGVCITILIQMVMHSLV